MNYSTAVMLINPNIRAIKAIYEPDSVDLAGKVVRAGQRYIFKTLDPSIIKGDLIVVPTTTRHGFTVVKVEEVDVEIDFEASIELKWIVDKVSVALTNLEQAVFWANAAIARNEKQQAA